MAALAPIKSRTDPPAPEEHRTQRPHITRRLHAGSFRSKTQWGASNHHPLKDTVQSTAELKPPINFDHLLRRDKKDPDPSVKAESHPIQTSDANGFWQQNNAMGKVVRQGDVAEAKRHNAKREEELRASMKRVEEIGMSSTRQLDDTYYAILDKASMLRSMVASLQHLADESKRMHTSFQEETKQLESDTIDSVKSFNNFNRQEKTINDLVGKLSESRTKTKQLNERLESARIRVEAYEMRYSSKQAKRRTQFQITWCALFGIVALVVAILVAKNRERVSGVVEHQLQIIGDLVDDVAAPARSRPSPSEDPLLKKLFDNI